MSESLKPCPFCGGKAMFLTITNMSSHSAVGVMFKIKCMKCGTELPKSYECVAETRTIHRIELLEVQRNRG